MLVASSSQKGALILCGLALCSLPCRRLLLCPFPVSSGAARRASRGSAPGTRSVAPTSYALPRKRATEMWLWEAQLSQEVNRTLWQVVKCQPAAHPRPALPHVPPPLRALQEQKKKKWLFRKNVTIWDFTALWLVSVGPQRLFTMKGGKKMKQQERGTNVVLWLPLLSSSLLHISVVCPFCHGSLSRVWVRCETRPSGVQ